MKRVDAVDSVEIIRRGHCSYRSPRCDCKFGVAQLGRVQGSEHGCGCPELGEVALVLAGLTEKQYVEAYRLGAIRAVRLRLRTSRVLRDARRPEEVPIRALGLSLRAMNALDNYGEHFDAKKQKWVRTDKLETVADVAIKVSADDLMLIRNCGRKSVREIRSALARFGLALRGEVAA